jgi:hypothetical protein
LAQEPEAAPSGLGGTYFFKDDKGHKVAIIKPCDEEPMAPNNPKARTQTLAQTSLQTSVAQPTPQTLSLHMTQG